jgi:DNA polymerase zeta
MIKKSMKLYRGREKLLRILDAKQLGLKLLANVTFGYTAASYSGRMPCVDISDAIIQSGRLTLERTIQLIESNERWNGQVVYGDTDSVFINFEGLRRDIAFKYAQEVVDQVTKENPVPVKLKFEKIYQPCVLPAKKRYVGFMYENLGDEPVFDAKGIETVRRDGCPAVQKILESSLKLLFRTLDLSKVKEYLIEQWSKIIKGTVTLSDFFIAKEVKLGNYRSKLLPPGAHLITKKMENDPTAEPEYGERIPYVVASRGINNRLIDDVVLPTDFINDDSLQLNWNYYITKQIIPPLSRIFNLIGVDVKQWYDEMPKEFRVNQFVDQDGDSRPKKTIDQYYKTTHCVICHARISVQNKIDLCANCKTNNQQSLLVLLYEKRRVEKRYQDIFQHCRKCTGVPDTNVINCVSIDCPVYHSRCKYERLVKVSVPRYCDAMKELEF